MYFLSDGMAKNLKEMVFCNINNLNIVENLMG